MQFEANKHSRSIFPLYKKLDYELSENDIRDSLTVLKGQLWQDHVNKLAYSKGWDVISLRCKKDHESAHPILKCFDVEGENQTVGGSTWINLPILSQLPSIEALLIELKCPVKSVRFMRLRPGCEILPHRDEGLGIEYRQARLHIPIASSDRVEFVVGGEKVPMTIGELWYVDADKEHWVKNNSDSARIHLVIDCDVNDWLYELVTGKQGVLEFRNIEEPSEQVRALLHQFHSLGDDEAGLIKQASDLLYQRIAEFAEFTDYSEGLNKENHTDTPHGKACSSDVAAMCTIEFMRNYRFQVGILKAIQNKISSSGPVELLYAGSGPFGSLVVPLLLFLQPNQIQVTIIDIHQESLDRLKRLVNVLKLSNFITDYHLADATDWQPDNGKTFDIIVSETMKAMLEQEPQVAVFVNLEKFLKLNGTLIPEKISIKAWLVDSSTEYNQTLGRENTSPVIPPICIANMFSLDRSTVKAIRENGAERTSKGKFTLPEDIKKFNLIQYSTDIQVYDNVVLGKKECSLTCPKVVPIDHYLADEEIHYEYRMGSYPKFSINH